MTELQKIKALPDEMITVAQAAKVLRVSPQGLREAARQRPDLLGFPATVCGRVVKIPRKPFIKFVQGEGIE